MGACRKDSTSGVAIVAGGPGSRRRARMLSTTSAEWTPPARASAQAASTAGRPSLSTADRILTIWRSPSSEPLSRRRRMLQQYPVFERRAVTQGAGLSGEHRDVMPGIVGGLVAAKTA